MSLTISEVEVSLKFPREIPIAEVIENSLSLFPEYPEISRFRDEDGPHIILRDEDGLKYKITEKEVIVSGSTNFNRLHDNSEIVALKILNSLKIDEKPETSFVRFNASKSKSFTIYDLFNENMHNVVKEFDIEFPGILLILPNKNYLFIRHKTRSDSEKGNIEIITSDIKLSENIINKLEEKIGKGDK